MEKRRGKRMFYTRPRAPRKAKDPGHLVVEMDKWDDEISRMTFVQNKQVGNVFDAMERQADKMITRRLDNALMGAIGGFMLSGAAGLMFVGLCCGTNTGTCESGKITEAFRVLVPLATVIGTLIGLGGRKH